MCLLCFLMMLVLGIADLAGIPLIRGNPLPASVQSWIKAHPGSEICGEVERYENTEFSQSVYLKKTYLIYHSKKFPINNVRVFLKKEEELKPGMQIFVKGILKEVEGPTNPGGFDSSRYYACRHIYYFMKKAVLLKKTSTYSGYHQAMLMVKEKCRQILENTAGKDAPVFEAIVLGEKTGLDPEIRMRYQLAGIVHILAISGLHISILGMGLYKLMKRVGFGIWPAGIFSLAVMLQYGMMTGGSVSTLRAVTMFLIAMGARITGRIYDMPSAVSVTAMMILAESPAYLLDSGFLLSFGCVLGICVASERICALAGAKRKGTKVFCESVALWLVTLPVMLKFFGEASLAGLVLNLAVLPSVGVVLAGGVAAMILGFVSIPTGRVMIFPARVLLFLYERLCELAGRSRWCTWIGGEPEIWQITIYYAILVAVLLIGQYIKESDQTKISRKQHILRISGIVLLILSILTLGKQSFRYSFKNQTLQITCLDVGQGDGILIRTPDNKHYLIDGGSSSQSELGRYCLLPALKSMGISCLDGIFISHTDKDHLSGVQELLEYMEKGLTTIRAAYLVLPGWTEPPEAWTDLASAAQKAGIKTVTGNAGNIIRSGAAAFEILWPESTARGKDVNEEAMVMELTYGDFRMLFTGDIGADTEKKLLSAGCLNDIDCLKVGHHGSGYSSSEEFLKKVKPELSIISCSSTNTYGHPSPETVKRLKDCGSQIEYTMKNGAIILETNGKNLRIRRFFGN
ncbi:DNA internalization-related competence protein ComEC/Rec2 [Ruminococcus sp. AF46-10NS]|nr:DNA internalization-related competence protein ComEC/Rec2 [Ruminococcus sp. AF46-10NS]